MVTHARQANGELRSIILGVLNTQPEIDRETLYDYIADELRVQRDRALNTSIGVALSWMERDKQVSTTKNEVFLLNGNGSSKPERQPHQPTTKRFVQANAVGDRVQISPFLAKRAPRNVTLESSPLLVEDVIKVEFQIGAAWFEVDSEGGLRICVGDEKPAWSPDEQTNYGVSCIRLTLKSGAVQEYGHNPNTPITTLRQR